MTISAEPERMWTLSGASCEWRRTFHRIFIFVPSNAIKAPHKSDAWMAKTQACLLAFIPSHRARCAFARAPADEHKWCFLYIKLSLYSSVIARCYVIDMVIIQIEHFSILITFQTLVYSTVVLRSFSVSGFSFVRSFCRVTILFHSNTKTKVHPWGLGEGWSKWLINQESKA